MKPITKAEARLLVQRMDMRATAAKVLQLANANVCFDEFFQIMVIEFQNQVCFRSPRDCCLVLQCYLHSALFAFEEMLAVIERRGKEITVQE